MPTQQFSDFLNHRLLILISQGHYGMDAFFVISGFLITRLLIKEYQESGTIDLKRFYFRRMLRIFPAYFTVLFIFASFFHPHCPNIWANILQVNNFLPMKNQCMGWTWSLAIECQFYFFAPFIISFFIRAKKIRFVLFTGSVAVLILISAYVVLRYQLYLNYSIHPTFNQKGFESFYDLFHDKTYTRIGPIVWGVIAAFLYHDTPIVRQWIKSKLVLWGSLVFAACCFWYSIFSIRVTNLDAVPNLSKIIFFISCHFVFSLGVALLMFLMLTASAKASKIISNFFSHIFWYPFAQLSYSVFLIHPIIISTCYDNRFFQAPTSIFVLLIQATFFILASFLLALPLYILIEKQFMDVRR